LNVPRAKSRYKPEQRSRDAGDDYILALASTTSAVVVSGDRDLLDLGGQLPIFTPKEFHAKLD
jgi:predicted nucleic acid-binding protein